MAGRRFLGYASSHEIFASLVDSFVAISLPEELSKWIVLLITIPWVMCHIPLYTDSSTRQSPVYNNVCRCVYLLLGAVVSMGFSLVGTYICIPP